jgi:hypothetical protein
MVNIDLATDCVVSDCKQPRAVLGNSQSVYCADHLREHLASLATGERDDLITVKLCSVQGCPNPRRDGYAKCADHMREQWNDAQSGVRPGPKPKKMCGREGCDQPRLVTSKGKVQQFCREHQNEYQRERAAARRANPTEAQRNAGYVSGGKIKKQPINLCVVDTANDRMIFIEGFVALECATDRDKLLPGGFDLLLESHAEDGYWIIQDKRADHG